MPLAAPSWRLLSLIYFLLLASLNGYEPVTVPNGSKLPWKMVDGVKEFHLVAEKITQEFSPGFAVNIWGYNGSSPGPVIECEEGDSVRILVTNNLPEPTTIHWHGILVPNKMDGVTGLNQRPILPGETFTYEFSLKQNGTYMYHPHFDETAQIGMGMMGMFIIHPRDEEYSVDRDFVIMGHEWFVPQGGATVDPTVMVDFNYFTFNGVVFPKVEPLVVKLGQRVRIRFGNLSMDSHPFHLHGHIFTVTGTGGGRIPKTAQYNDVTINVPVGSTRDIEFIANNPGDWALHCHKSHHVMNGMGHNQPNMIDVPLGKWEERIEKLIPGFISMGETGMGEMAHMSHHMPLPKNFLPFGSKGPLGIIDMSGMFTIVKIRDHLESYNDPGWYNLPPNNSTH